MLWYFKKFKYLYLSIIAFGFTSYILLGLKVNGKLLFSFGIEESDGILPILLQLVWIFGWAIIFNIFAMKEFNKITNILNDQCNPIEYTDTLKELINQKTFRKPYITTLLLYLIVGLNESGKFEESLNVLRSINRFSKGVRGIGEKINYFNSLFSAYIRNKEIDNACKVLENMNKTIKNTKLTEDLEKLYQSTHTQMLFSLNIEQDNYNDAEPFFKLKFENAKSNYERVCAKLNLGRIYLHYGDIANAKLAFEYVVKNGNMLYKVNEAKEYLEKIV